MENSIKNERSSIEEITKIIERKIKEAEHYTDITGLCLTLDKELCNAFINILSDYKRVLKENEELKVIKSAIQTLQTNSLEEEKYIVISKSSFLVGSYKHLLDDYIPIQKIKDKIEELSKTKGDLATHIAVSERIRALQEILEESEE